MDFTSPLVMIKDGRKNPWLLLFYLLSLIGKESFFDGEFVFIEDEALLDVVERVLNPALFYFIVDEEEGKKDRLTVLLFDFFFLCFIRLKQNEKFLDFLFILFSLLKETKKEDEFYDFLSHFIVTEKNLDVVIKKMARSVLVGECEREREEEKSHELQNR